MTAAGARCQEFWRGDAVASPPRPATWVRTGSPQDLALAIVAGSAGVQRDRRGGRLFGINERGFAVVARERRQVREELTRQLIDEVLGQIAAADEQPLGPEGFDRLALTGKLVGGDRDRLEEWI